MKNSLKLLRSVRVELLILLLVTSFLLSGCVISKTKYASVVKADLSKYEKELNENAKSSPDDIEKQLKLIKDLKSDLGRVNPPDDFFIGHAELVEFLQLLSEEMDRMAKVSSGGKTSSSADVSSNLMLLKAGNNAYIKAGRELPFLEYELGKTLNGVIKQVQEKSLKSRTSSLKSRTGR